MYLQLLYLPGELTLLSLQCFFFVSCDSFCCLFWLSMVTTALFRFLFVWSIFCYPFTFSLCESLYLKWISCRQNKDESFFFLNPFSQCFWNGMFNPFTYNYWHGRTYYYHFVQFSVYLVAFSSFTFFPSFTSSFVFHWFSCSDMSWFPSHFPFVYILLIFPLWLSLHVTSCSSFAAFKILTLYVTFDSLIMMCLSVGFFILYLPKLKFFTFLEFVYLFFFSDLGKFQPLFL